MWICGTCVGYCMVSPGIWPPTQSSVLFEVSSCYKGVFACHCHQVLAYGGNVGSLWSSADVIKVTTKGKKAVSKAADPGMENPVAPPRGEEGQQSVTRVRGVFNNAAHCPQTPHHIGGEWRTDDYSLHCLWSYHQLFHPPRGCNAPFAQLY